MKKLFTYLCLLVIPVFAQDYWPSADEINGPEITPGSTAIPKKFKRPDVFVLSIDYKTRIGQFRSMKDGSLIEATILPHAEILHNGADGNLQDFKKYEHVIVRLHPNSKGQWKLASYVKGDIKHQHSHKQYWEVKSIDEKTGKVEGLIHGHKGIKGPITFFVDKNTKYWLAGQEVKADQLKVGSRVKTRTHCSENGTSRIAWDVILDDHSLESLFLKPQVSKMLQQEKELGVPAYVNAIENNSVTFTIFREPAKRYKNLKKGSSVDASSADWALKTNSQRIGGKVSNAKYKGAQGLHLSIIFDEVPKHFKVSKHARIWLK